MHEPIRSYIRAALARKYPVETIVNNLVSAGHDPSLVRRLTREIIAERLHELEREIAGDPMSEAEKAGRRSFG